MSQAQSQTKVHDPHFWDYMWHALKSGPMQLGIVSPTDMWQAHNCWKIREKCVCNPWEKYGQNPWRNMTEIQSEIGAIASRAERQGGCIIAEHRTNRPIQCVCLRLLCTASYLAVLFNAAHHCNALYVVGWITLECRHIRVEMQTKVVSTVPQGQIFSCCNTLLLKRIYTPGRPQAPLDELVSLLHALLPLQPLLWKSLQSFCQQRCTIHTAASCNLMGELTSQALSSAMHACSSLSFCNQQPLASLDHLTKKCPLHTPLLG